MRGANIFGPPEAAIVLAQFLKPFEEWGVYGASSSTARVEGGSDNGAFAVAGLPGIGAQQDPIEYNSTTWHTDLDNYERIVPDDVMKNAVVSAAVVYGIANRDKMMPRFAPSDMPAVPAGRGGGAGRGNLAGAEPHMFFVPKGKALTVAAPGLVGRHRRRDRACDPAGNRRGCRRAGARQARAEAGRELRLHARAQLRGQRHVHLHADAKRGDQQSRAP